MVNRLSANLPYEKQTIEEPNTRKPGQTGHYRNAIWEGVVKLDDRPIKTLVDAWDYNFKKAKDKPFLGHRPVVSVDPLKFSDTYVWETYGEVDERRRNAGSALQYLFSDGTLGKEGELQTVGLWMQNRPEWRVIDLATAAYNKVSVCLYDALSEESIEFIIQHACVTIMFTTADHAATLLSMSHNLPMLKMIVIVGNISPETKIVLKTWGDKTNVQIWDFEYFEQLGRQKRVDVVPATRNQVASICYTSGTSGMTKGVILSHGNIVAGADAFSISSNVLYDLDKLNCVISYLPLAHIYERIVELVMIIEKNRIGFSTGDPLRLLEDAQILKPDVFPMVPRLLGRLYQALKNAAASPSIKGRLLKQALETKIKNYRETGTLDHMLWDRVVFHKVRAVLGGKVSHMTLGSALSSADVVDTMRVALNLNISNEQGNLSLLFEVNISDDISLYSYGLTESCATGTHSLPWDPTAGGTIGPPFAYCEIKLVDIDELGYTSQDKPYPRGEICIRGDTCFSAYYKDEEATRETIDEEGWMHTGDIGEIDGQGRLNYIDRKKNIIKLSQGEFIALDYIQSVYGSCPIVMQLYVHGDPLQDHVVAIVVPESVGFVNFVRNIESFETISDTDSASLVRAVKDERVIKALLTELNKEAQKAKLKGYETIKNIFITLEPFTVENGLLTPTFKLKRREVRDKYKSELDTLYSMSPLVTGVTTRAKL